jgi:hypothetical protein
MAARNANEVMVRVWLGGTSECAIGISVESVGGFMLVRLT